jgi:hypothetical protein
MNYPLKTEFMRQKINVTSLPVKGGGDLQVSNHKGMKDIWYFEGRASLWT